MTRLSLMSLSIAQEMMVFMFLFFIGLSLSMNRLHACEVLSGSCGKQNPADDCQINRQNP